jgi:hypothetical protein
MIWVPATGNPETVMRQQMQTTIHTDDDFWSGSYRGHTIATLNRGSGWLVYLDHVLQHNKLFVTADAAVTWLHQQIDGPSGERSRAEQLEGMLQDA